MDHPAVALLTIIGLLGLPFLCLVFAVKSCCPVPETPFERIERQRRAGVADGHLEREERLRRAYLSALYRTRQGDGYGDMPANSALRLGSTTYRKD